MKGNAMRNNINVMLLALLLINSGVGAMVLFGMLKGGLLTLAIVTTIYANIWVQERKARENEEVIKAGGMLSEKEILEKIYGKHEDNRAYKVIGISRNRKTNMLYVTYMELGQCEKYTEKLIDFLDTTYIKLDLEKTREKNKRKVKR
ncbi:MAG: hypothetical protein Q4B89_00900 [Lachnospiraceae bacterium]|nr:hypothetical protein [Lachnospiraceae bacterium]